MAHVLALWTHKLWNFMLRFCVSYISVKCMENEININHENRYGSNTSTDLVSLLFNKGQGARSLPWIALTLESQIGFLLLSVFFFICHFTKTILQCHCNPYILQPCSHRRHTIFFNIQVKWFLCPCYMFGEIQTPHRPLENWSGVACNSSGYFSLFSLPCVPSHA